MDISVKEKNNCTREILISVPWDEVEPSFNKFVTKFAKSVKLTGFRSGKVPKKILFQRFMPAIEMEFTKDAIEEFYMKALVDSELVPLNQASIDNLEFNYGNPLKFNAEFEIEPEVQLPKYEKKFKVQKNVFISDNEDVEIYIKELLQQHAKLETVESDSEDGHILLVDLRELDNSAVPIIGRKVEDRYIKVGEGIFGGDNLNKLTGLKIGDSAIIDLEMQGQEEKVKYQLTVKNVQIEILPELSEEFIKSVDKSSENESQFRDSIMKRIQAKLDQDTENQLEQSIISYFIDNTDLEVPPSMVDNYLHKLAHDVKDRNSESFNEEKYMEEMRPSTYRNLKWFLIRRELISDSELVISDDEITSKVTELVEGLSDQKSEIERYYKKPSNRDRLREDLLDKRLMEYLLEYANVKEVKVYTKDLRKQHSIQN